MRRRRFSRTVGVVATVYLVAMAVVFALLSAQNAAFTRTSSTTEGTVVALVARAPLGSTRESRPDARTPSLAPKVTYTVAGQSYTYVAAHGRYRQRLQVGNKVTVLYAPDDPASARLRGEGQDLGPLISAAFAVAAVLVALVLLRLRRHRGTTRTRRRDSGADATREDARAASAVAD